MRSSFYIVKILDEFGKTVITNPTKIITLVNLDITANMLGISNPGKANANYVVRVYKNDDTVPFSTKLIKNVNANYPKLIKTNLKLS